MITTYLFDTGLFIAFLRQSNPAAQGWVSRAAQKQITAGISAITSYELWQGVLTEEHQKQHKILLTGYQVHPITEKIARRAAGIYRAIPMNRRSKSLHLDILIAATADYYCLTLVTLNTKDFSQFDLQNAKVIYLNPEDHSVSN